MSDVKTKRRGRRQRRSGRSRSGAFRPIGFSASQSLKARAVQFGTISSSGTGVVAGLIPFDPSSGHLNVTEFNSDWANLFTQYRLWGVRIKLLSCISTSLIESVTANNMPIAVGYQWRSTATLATPSNYDAVLDNQPSQLWPVSGDTSKVGLVMSQKTPSMITYLETNATTSPGNAGAPGAFQFYGNNFTASIPIFTYFIEVYYQLRSRS